MELVSVIITTCNGTEKLLRAIKSALNQRYASVEVIVVDDNGKGTEKQLYTESLIQPFLSEDKIKYLVHDVNKNGAVARNTGAMAAKGEYLAFLDDDDFFLPSRLELLVDRIKAAKVEIAYSGVLFLKDNKIVSSMEAKTDGFTHKDLLMDQSLLGTGSNIFVSRVVYDKISGFDETFKRYQDVEFMIRALEVGRIIGVNDYTVVKDISEVRFYPQYDRFVSAQEHFLNKFKEEICKLGVEERRECILSKRKELYYAACMSKNKNNVADAVKRMQESITDLDLKEKLKIKFRGLYMGSFYGLVSPVRAAKQSNRAKILRSELPRQVMSEIGYILE